MEVHDVKTDIITIPIKRKRKIFFIHILLGELISGKSKEGSVKLIHQWNQSEIKIVLLLFAQLSKIPNKSLYSF